MKRASVEGDANTDDDQLSRADQLAHRIYALMEAHRARTAVPAAASPQLAPSPAVSAAASSKLAPSLDVPVAASPELAPSLDVPVAALPKLATWLDLPGAASPQLPPSPAVPGAASRQLPPSLDVPSVASPKLAPRLAVPDAASPQLPPSFDVPSVASPKLAPWLAVPGAASPKPAPSPAVPRAASPKLPPWLAVPRAASPQLPSSARNGAPPTEGQAAPVGSRRTDLSNRVSPDAPPRMPIGVGGPNIEFRSRLGPRQGDFSINEAWNQSSLASDVVPKPPVPMRGGASRVGGLILLILIAGLSAFGLVLITSPDRATLVSPSAETANTPGARPPAAGIGSP